MNFLDRAVFRDDRMQAIRGAGSSVPNRAWIAGVNTPRLNENWKHATRLPAPGTAASSATASRLAAHHETYVPLGHDHRHDPPPRPPPHRRPASRNLSSQSRLSGRSQASARNSWPVSFRNGCGRSEARLVGQHPLGRPDNRDLGRIVDPLLLPCFQQPGHGPALIRSAFPSQ